MEWLNYHHLLYFWTVVRSGSVSKASEELRLAQPTVSGQIHALEEAFGEKLFRRSGRRLELTDFGRVVFRYADEIFHLGKELTDTVRGRPTGKPLRFAVGISDVVPKLVAHQLLLPAMQLKERVRLLCIEGSPDRLLAALALHEIDLVIADAPIPSGLNIRGYNHLLGESGMSVFGVATIASKYRKGFPKSLDGAPFLLPREGTMARRSIDAWFNQQNLTPTVLGEFQDSALLKVFGQSGMGLFYAPTVLEKQIERQYAVKLVGRIPQIREQFYAISAERRLAHPAVLAIADSARKTLEH